MKVIRVVVYEGTEESVRHAIQMSLPLGIKQCGGYTMTIGEHLNELPELITLTEADVAKAIEDTKNETND